METAHSLLNLMSPFLVNPFTRFKSRKRHIKHLLTEQRLES